MELALRNIREEYGKTKKEFAELIGMKELFYAAYEERQELPSKYVYQLWKKLPKFPIPDDFFFYTSFVLEVNMKYHNMTQMELAIMFDIANQSTISGYLQDNIPMYEKKEYFQKFEPFVLPTILTKGNNGKYNMKEITDLVPKGNFILVEKRRQQKIRRLENEKQKETV